MCNCIKEVAKVALEHAAKQMNPSIDEKLLGPEENWNQGVQNVGFLIGGGLRLKTDIVFTTDFKKKDGSRSKPKKSHISLVFTYCPFCGKEYVPKKEQNPETCDATDVK